MAGTENVDLPQQKEKISKGLKAHLNEWKEIIVLLNAIIAWEKNWYPAITIACITSLYLYVWLVNCSILNLVWTGCMCATLLDFFVCGPFQRTLPPNGWNPDKERTYTAIVEYAVDCWMTFMLYVVRFFRLRQTNNKLQFHSTLLVAFSCLLYVGTTFNNLFMSYILILVILLFPGFKTRSEYIEDSLQKYGYLAVSYLWSNENKIVSS